MCQAREPWVLLISVLLLTSSAFPLETIPRGKSVQFGRLIIGSSRTANETKNGIVKRLHDENAGDVNGYQPELREWSQLAKLRLQRLSPSVQCDDESMTLRIQGSQVPNFLVKTNEQGPVLLSKMPSHCGFSLKRARRDVALTARYHGCNVAQQENAYILPLRVLGVAVDMVCPVARPITTVFCNPTAMVVNLAKCQDAIRLKVNDSWQPVHQASSCGFTFEVVGSRLALTAPYTSNCWQFKGAEMFLSVQYMNGELTLSCPAVPRPATTPLLPSMQSGTSTVTPSTTLAAAVAPASSDQALPYWRPAMPYAYGVPWYFQYSNPGTHPVAPVTTTPATTTTSAPATTPATAVAPPSADQQALPSWLSGLYNPSGYSIPQYFPYTQPEAPTSATPQANKRVLYPWLSGLYNPSGYSMPQYFQYSQSGAQTLPPLYANQQALYSWLSGLYNPSGYSVPQYFPYSQPGPPPVDSTSAPTTTTVASSSADEPHLYHLPGMNNPNIASPAVLVPGFNSGVNLQRYQIPWISTFRKNMNLNQTPGSPLSQPSNVVPYSAHFSPLRVKGLRK